MVIIKNKQTTKQNKADKQIPKTSVSESGVKLFQAILSLTNSVY